VMSSQGQAPAEFPPPSPTWREILRHGVSGFTSPLKEGVLSFFIALKNPTPRPGLNPRTLSPMASILTIAPIR
jgi:hypothetical protein